MADLTPVPANTPVPQIDRSTRVLGGPGGPANSQAQALLNRQALLSQRTDNALLPFSTLAEATAAAATLPDGQPVDAMDEQKRYRVEAGALVFVANLDQLGLDLADRAIGPTIMGYSGALNYAVGTIGARLGSEINIKDFPWLCQCDGVTDDTAGLHAAITRAKQRGSVVFHPGGVCRVTSGYMQSVIRQNVAFRGPARTTSDIVDTLGAIFELDSTDPESYFYEVGASHHISAKSIRFRCKQFVQDRAFIKFGAGALCNHTFTDVAFDRVERPIVYKNGFYFQSSAFTNVQFNDSGTFHSEAVGNALIGTLLTLTNVSHDGVMPANTEKVVCNLTGVRLIQGTNFLLEGRLPALGYTVLKLSNTYNAGWTRAPLADFNGFFNEWTGLEPTYAIDQTGGRVTFNQGDLRLSASMKYKLSGQGKTNICGVSFTTQDLVNDLFDIEDFRCNVTIENSSLRAYNLSDPRFSFIDCATSVDGSVGAEGIGSTAFSNTQSSLIYKWDGGYFDGDLASMNPVSGTTATPSSDATHGRKFSLIPLGNVLDAYFQVKPRGAVTQFSQYWILVSCKLPTFTGGAFTIQPHEAGVTGAGGASYTASSSGQDIVIAIPTRMLTPATNIGVRIRSTATGVSGNLEIYSVAAYLGNSAPRIEYPSYPKNIITRNSAAPVAGAWERGDLVWNTAPSAGGPLGWVCIATGTPGTWVPVGSIQSANTYTPTNVTTDRAFDADTVVITELADVVGTLIADLKASGVLK